MKNSTPLKFKIFFKICSSHSCFSLMVITLAIFCQTTSYGQFGTSQFILTGGVGYTKPLNSFKDLAKFGKGIELNIFWEQSKISDNLDIVMLTSVNQFNTHEFMTNSTLQKKFISFQQLDGLVYKFKPFFIGGGIGFTIFSKEYVSYSSGINAFIVSGINPLPRLRLLGKYIFARPSDLSLLNYFGNFNSLGISISYDIFNSNSIY